VKILTLEINNNMSSIDKDRAKIMNELRWGKLEDRYDWNHIQELHDRGVTMSRLRKEYKLPYAALKNAREQKLFIVNENINIRKKHTDETKRNLSEKRKQWLKDNPDKHPWRNKDKFKSKPCEKVKEFLTQLNISYIEEYQPEIDSRSFSIDIALPDKMIALEINGNQHYERDGTLKAYYQERHDLLEANGWDVYEIHYSACFNLDKWGDFIDKLSNANVKVEFDYFNYIPRTKKVKCCIDCGIDISKTACRCNQCAAIKQHSHRIKPSKEELENLLWELPFTKIGKKYEVSDNAIRKWCRSYGIVDYPPRGYFIRK
jgi:hypothetical protein